MTHSFEAMDASQEIALMREAITDGDMRLVKRLVAEGFDMTCSLAEPNEGYTVLHYAASLGQVEIACYFIGLGADVNAKLTKGQTPLHIAAFHSNLEMCQLLIEHGADVNAVNELGNSVLHWWARGARNVDVCKLLADSGCALHPVDKQGKTPLHLVTSDIEAFAALVKKGANHSFVPRDPPENYVTPFQQAVIDGCTELVRALVAYRAEDVHQLTISGKSMFELAANKSQMLQCLHSIMTELAVCGALSQADGTTKPRSVRMGPL